MKHIDKRVTWVLSPLTSLMKNQVQHIADMNVSSVALDSTTDITVNQEELEG